jgi:PIN domain nuclease of toxin-antitoxin system
MVNGDRRLRPDVRRAITDPETSLHVSAVIAYEYADLQARRRLPVTETLDELAERFDLTFEALPAGCWRIASGLPPIHRDPVDRMLIAHALAEGWALATADANIRRYPVDCI